MKPRPISPPKPGFESVSLYAAYASSSRMRWYVSSELKRGTAARFATAGAVLVLAVVHLLFAYANITIREPVEAAFAAVAGVSLFVSTVFILRREEARAAACALAGTVVLTLWFVVTVPLGRSTSSLLLVSLVTPAAAALYLVVRGLTRGFETRRTAAVRVPPD